MKSKRLAVRHRLPFRLLLLVAVSIFLAEFGIMLVFSSMPKLPGFWEPTIDATILTVVVLPVLFFAVFRPLTRHLEAQQQAELALRGMYEQLDRRVQERTSELEQRNREIGLLADAGNLLQACATVREASEVITRAGRQLFPGTMGALFVYSPSRDDMESLGRWGNWPNDLDINVFAPDTCWALRRGRTYQVDDAVDGPLCGHVHTAAPRQYLCVPLMANGEVLGLLNLQEDSTSVREGAGALALNRSLAEALCECAGLSLMDLKLRETLRNQSIRDPLTNLFNRRYMEETLQRELSRAERDVASLSVVMVDVDHFKVFNDTYGHEAGDVLLKEVGQIFSTHLRGHDIACRYGGEEFVLILPGTPLDVALPRLNALRMAVQQLRVRHQGKSLKAVSVSMGLAAFPQHGASVEDLLRVADNALYHAKSQGRNRVVVAEPATFGLEHRSST